MTDSQIIGLITGVAYLIAASIAVPAVALLGPSYATHTTVHWRSRMVGILYAFVLFFRGLTILYPGGLVVVASMSEIAPMLPIMLIVLNTVILDFIVRHRAPPPLFERIVRFFAGRDVRKAVDLAFALPTASVSDVPSDEPDKGTIKRSHRLAVLIGGGVVLALVALFVVASSPVAGG